MEERIMEFVLGLGKGKGSLIKENTKTVIVKLMSNGETIKRHKIKHKVKEVT